MAANLEKDYNPRRSVPNVAEIFARWGEQSAVARSSEAVILDVAYGSHATETMDVFRARGASRGLLMFIHGGYWRALDKRDHSFIASAYTASGITVAIPNYALCPAVTVEDIVRQMLQATAWLYRNGGHFGAPYNKVYVAGHSAGGHLTAMLLAALFPAFAADLPKRTVQAGMSLSGVYDIAPIMHVPSVQNDVRLTQAMANRASPALMPPASDAPLYTAFGGIEPNGFHGQDALIRKRWAAVHKGSVDCPEDNHFSILDRFATHGSNLHKAVLQMMGVT